MNKHRMRALMSLPATATRKAKARGEEFDAGAQERRDLLQMGQAEDVKAEEKPAARKADAAVGKAS